MTTKQKPRWLGGAMRDQVTRARHFLPHFTARRPVCQELQRKPRAAPFVLLS